MRAFTILLGLSLLVVGATWFLMFSMPGSDWREPLPPLSTVESGTAQRLHGHVQHLAGQIGARSYDQPRAQAAARDYIESELTGAGYPVQHETFTVGGREYTNLVVERPGPGQGVVVIGAHYDTVPGSPGADDNASGIAALIELAAMQTTAYARTVRYVAFINEEEPFHRSDSMGSRVHAGTAKARNEEIIAMLSLESLGYFDTAPGSQHYPPPLSLIFPDTADFIGFVGNLDSRALVRAGIDSFRRHGRFPSQGIAAPQALVPDIERSDHSSFWQEGYPAIMVTGTAPFRNARYHTVHDTPDTLDYASLARVITGLSGVVYDLANPKP